MRIKRKGYLWKCYGFTMTHMWGLHLVSGFFAIVGIGMLTFAILGMNEISESLFYKLIASSSAISLAGIAMILYSIFTILFYRHAENIDEGEKEV